MAELNIRIFRRDLDHVVEVSEGIEEQQLRAVEVDHALHGLLDGDGFRHVLFFEHLEPRRGLQCLDRFVMGLVEPEVVLGSDIDPADRQRGRSAGAAGK